MFRTLSLTAICLTLFALAFSSAAEARPHLRDHDYINSQLFIAAVGDQIRKNCSSISARMGQVYSRGRALYNYALDQGYSRREISDYLESKEDNRRMKDRANAYLAKRGVEKGNSASYCRAGRAEIAEQTPIGVLLRVR